MWHSQASSAKRPQTQTPLSLKAASRAISKPTPFRPDTLGGAWALPLVDSNTSYQSGLRQGRKGSTQGSKRRRDPADYTGESILQWADQDPLIPCQL